MATRINCKRFAYIDEFYHVESVMNLSEQLSRNPSPFRKLQGATNGLVLYMYPQLHFVNLYKFFINDQEVPVKPSWWKLFGKKSTVEDILVVEDPVRDFDTCYRADQEGREEYFPIVKLYFDSDRYCLAFKKWDKDFTILGHNQLQAVGL
ncbi:hypothetical protein H5410_052098 [Solanum commersonii]|uniref:Uncharacterized protein n=1 Tax=Solanum commersonii TaxID=4109 RepID=A0A9J5X1A5_SOLCO|nr:hypothetical protein H5410_052098 [Solanum commersonii]